MRCFAHPLLKGARQPLEHLGLFVAQVVKDGREVLDQFALELLELGGRFFRVGSGLLQEFFRRCGCKLIVQQLGNVVDLGVKGVEQQLFKKGRRHGQADSRCRDEKCIAHRVHERFKALLRCLRDRVLSGGISALRQCTHLEVAQALDQAEKCPDDPQARKNARHMLEKLGMHPGFHHQLPVPEILGRHCGSPLGRHHSARCGHGVVQRLAVFIPEVGQMSVFLEHLRQLVGIALVLEGRASQCPQQRGQSSPMLDGGNEKVDDEGQCQQEH